jgi:hypothetical protein
MNINSFLPEDEKYRYLIDRLVNRKTLSVGAMFDANAEFTEYDYEQIIALLVSELIEAKQNLNRYTQVRT